MNYSNYNQTIYNHQMLFIVVSECNSDTIYIRCPEASSMQMSRRLLIAVRFDMDLITISGSSVGFPDATGPIAFVQFSLTVEGRIVVG